jgi:hypothetical protein
VLFVETLMSDPATAGLIPDWLDDPYFPDFWDILAGTHPFFNTAWDYLESICATIALEATELTDEFLGFFGYRSDEFRDELGNLALPPRLDAYFVKTYETYVSEMDAILSRHAKYMKHRYQESPYFAAFAAKVAPLFLAYHYARAK